MVGAVGCSGSEERKSSWFVAPIFGRKHSQRNKLVVPIFRKSILSILKVFRAHIAFLIVLKTVQLHKVNPR